MLAVSENVHPYDFQQDGFYYTVISENPNYVEITTNSNDHAGNLVIPSQVIKNEQTYIVKRIGSLGTNTLSSLTIPSTIDSIAYGCFGGCKSLIEINVDHDNPVYCSIDGVLFNKDKSYIRYFPTAKGPKYTIPDGVRIIARGAFYKLVNLRELIIPSSVTIVESQAFSSCESLKEINFNSLERIERDAFWYCSFESISLPENLKYIEDVAFNYCNSLKSIYIPKSVEYIGYENSAIGYCSALEKIDVDPDNQHYSSINGILYNKEQTIVLKCPVNIQDQEWITLPSTLTRIASCAFHSNKNLARIVIPQGVKVIENGAFYYCTNLNRVTCLATTPPSTPETSGGTCDPFYESSRYRASLYVPKGCAQKYKEFYNTRQSPYTSYPRQMKVYPWADFKEIVEVEEETDIKTSNIDYSIEELSRYNTSGQIINSSTKGINIIKMRDGSFRKYFVK